MSVTRRRRDLVRDDVEVLEERRPTGTSHGEANQSRPAQQSRSRRSRCTRRGRTRRGGGSRGRSSCPTASRAARRACARASQISGVRFWNFTASRAGVGGDVDEPLGELDVAVVVEADLGDHVDGAAAADRRSVRCVTRHALTPLVAAPVGACGSRRGCGRASDPVGELAHRARRRPAGSSTTRAAASTSGCASGTATGQPTSVEAGEVVDVVAEVGDAVEADAARGGPLAQRGGLVVDALAHVDAELRGARGDDRVGLGRQDQHRDAGARAAARRPCRPLRLTRTSSRPSASTHARCRRCARRRSR